MCRRSGLAVPNVYGPGTGQIWLDDVQCTGNESSLVECRHGGWGVHYCVGHKWDMSILCDNRKYNSVFHYYCRQYFVASSIKDVFVNVEAKTHAAALIFSAMSSNGWRPPVTAGMSWSSATIGGCRAQQTPIEGLNRLREANRQWKGIPIGNGPRKNEYLKTSVRTGNDINLFSLEALVCHDETEIWSQEMTERLFNAL